MADGFIQLFIPHISHQWGLKAAQLILPRTPSQLPGQSRHLNLDFPDPSMILHVFPVHHVFLSISLPYLNSKCPFEKSYFSPWLKRNIISQHCQLTFSALSALPTLHFELIAQLETQFIISCVLIRAWPTISHSFVDIFRNAPQKVLGLLKLEKARTRHWFENIP